MPSGITHILLSKSLQNELPDEGLKMNLAAAKNFFQVGAVGPDLPYASIADNDWFLTSQSDLADQFHHHRTNQIALEALPVIKNISKLLKKKKRAHFAYYLGYMSHIVSDGIFHPFIRDVVGDYEQNQTAHRVFEMRLDVLLFNHFYQRSGMPAEFNKSNIHDELENLEKHYKTRRMARKVMRSFKNRIASVYGENYEVDKILSWIKGLHRLFDFAEGEHPAIYKNISILDDFLFPNLDEVIRKAENIYTLKKPKDRELNFLQQERVHVIDDCIPRFYQVFIPIAEKSYNYVYLNGPALTEKDIPEINLDTGRPVSDHQDLDLIPTFWS